MKTVITAALLLFCFVAHPSFSAASPTLTPPATENVSAGLATLVLKSSESGTGYFTLLTGSGTACGTGTQVKDGQNSSGALARYRGSLSLPANSPRRYTVRNLPQSTAYTVCFTADSPSGQNLQEVPSSSNFGTSAAISLTDKEWKTVGAAGFSAGQASFISQAFAPDGTPYIAYIDGSNSGKVTVMKFSSGIWSVVGSAGFSAYAAQATALAFAPDGTLYVAHQSLNASSVPITTLMVLGGTNWVTLGTMGSGQNASLAFAPNGSLYTAFKDSTRSDRVTVMKFGGGVIGTQGFSAAGPASAISLAFTADSTPFVAYRDGTNGNQISMQRFNGTNWVLVGAVPFSGTAGFSKLALAPDNTLFMAFQYVSGIAMVVRSSGFAPGWTTFGSLTSAGTMTDVSLAISPEGTPAVAFRDVNTGSKATAMKYNGSSWVALGSAGFSSDTANPVSVAFAPDGRPYVAYGNGAAGKATVMRLDISDTTTTLSSDKAIASAGESVTFTATISKSAASGTVSFMEGTTLLAAVPLSSGVAAYSTSGLSVGYHTITAVYAGDSSFNGTTSAAQQVEIRPVGFVVISAISSPVSGYATNTSSLTVFGTAARVDGDSLKLVEVSADGGATWLPAASTTAWSRTLLFPVEGVFAIKSRATTNAGVVETPSAGISVTIDRTAPTGNIMSAVLNDSNSVTLTLNTRANTPGWGCLDYLPIVCGYQDITLSYDEVTWTPWVQAEATKQYSITMIGQKTTIYAKLRDNAGNISMVLNAPVQGGVCGTAINGYNSTAPTISLCSVGTVATFSGSGPWSWSCSNPVGGTPVNCSAAKAAGLVYNSTNAGVDWTAGKSGFGSNEGISSISVSPAYSSDHTLFMTGKNLYRSNDNGNSWTQTRYGWGSQITLVVSPGYATDKTIFSGQFNGGIFKNVDASPTWTTINTGLANLMVHSLAVSPVFASDKTLFTGLYNNGVYKSTDSGDTWQAANAGLKTLSPVILAVSPTYAVDSTVFAVTTDGMYTNNGPHYHVYKSTDGGGNWNLADSGLTGQFTALAISPSYAGDQTLFVAAANGINKSTDGGTTWTESYATNFISSIVISPGYATDQTLFAANGSRVLTSGNGGGTWDVANQNFTGGSLLRTLAISPGFTTDHVMFAATSLVGPFPVVTPSISFGSIKKNSTSEIRKITIANTSPGDSSLTVSGITLWGYNPEQFRIAPGSCASLTPTLEVGSECTIDVTFSPAIAGVLNANVTISMNASMSPTTNVTLNGIGVTVTSAITTPASGFVSGSASAAVAGTAGCSYGNTVVLVEVSSDGGTTWQPANGTTSWSVDLELPSIGTYTVVSRATTSGGVVESHGPGITVIRNSVVGTCGADNDKVLSVLAPLALCDKGTPSEVSGAGHPWSWLCQGDVGTVPAVCSASIQSFTLAVGIKDGSGKGDVQADPASDDASPISVFCPTSFCTAHFDYGRTVRLTATPDPISMFTAWEGVCSTNPCDIVMSADTMVTAAFTRDASYKNKESGALDNSLDALLLSVNPGEEIRMLATELTINSLVLNKALALSGGWKAGHAEPAADPTVLNGSITIQDSEIKLDAITLKGKLAIHQGGTLRVTGVTLQP